MKEQLTNKIEEFKTVVSTLPENTIVNRKKKRAVLDRELEEKTKILATFKKEIITRSSVFSAYQENKQIKKIDEDLEKCKLMHEWNRYNSPFEKMHLDYYLYQLHRYYRNDLASVNKCILKIIETFSNVSIELTANDFSYNKYAKNYIELLLSSTNKKALAELFEKLYWQFPEILTTIELNFKGIYLKQERKIEKYYQTREEEYLKTHHEEELILLNISLHEKKESILATDAYTILQKFIKKEFNIHDFNELNEQKKIKRFFPNGNYNELLTEKVFKTLRQYQLILNNEYLLVDMKKRLGEKETYKGKKATVLKEINSLEKKIIKANNVVFKEKKIINHQKRDEKLIFHYKENLDNLEIKMNELEEANFNETIFKKLSADSSILEVFQFICANYLYFVKRAKEKEENVAIGLLTERFLRLQEFIYNNEFTLINHLALLDDNDLKMIIADKFKLEDINLLMEDLEPDNLDNTLKDIAFLINYNHLQKSQLNPSDIAFYLEAKEKKELWE